MAQRRTLRHQEKWTQKHTHTLLRKETNRRNKQKHLFPFWKFCLLWSCRQHPLNSQRSSVSHLLFCVRNGGFYFVAIRFCFLQKERERERRTSGEPLLLGMRLDAQRGASVRAEPPLSTELTAPRPWDEDEGWERQRNEPKRRTLFDPRQPDGTVAKAGSCCVYHMQQQCSKYIYIWRTYGYVVNNGVLVLGWPLPGLFDYFISYSLFYHASFFDYNET